MIWIWLFLTLQLAVLALWLFFNLSPARKNCFNHQLHAQDVQLDEHEQDALPPLPPTAVICPGRNEAAWIDKTLPDLCQQDYPGLKVIFIDDHSDDATPAITAEMGQHYPHLTVVRNEVEPPPGWVGKCWAVSQGYAALESQPDAQDIAWLCFTDADIRWQDQTLKAAMRHGQRHEADVVALFPRLIFGSTSERLGQITMVLALGLLFPFQKAMDPRCPDTLTGGAFILVRRSLYDQIGGHESVKGCVVEDLNLGRNLKAAGAKIRIAVTPELLQCRMYEGFADMWEGLTKNAYAGMNYKPHWAAGFLLAALIANILPPTYLLAGIVLAIRHPHDARLWVCIVVSLAVLLLQARAMNNVRKLLHLPWWWAWSVPPGSALYSVFIIVSIWRYYLGGNVWKGRKYGRQTLQG